MSERTTQAALREVARDDFGASPAAVIPQPAVLPEPKREEPTPAPAPEKDTSSYRRRVLLVLSAIVAALGLYWASGYFFAYTDDAYVTSDLVSVAPYVSGRIVAVNIVDNQAVKKAKLLADNRSEPFQLSLNEKQAKKRRGRGPARGRPGRSIAQPSET